LEGTLEQIKGFWNQVVCLRHEITAALDGRKVSASVWENTEVETGIADYNSRLSGRAQRATIDKLVYKAEDLLATYDKWRTRKDSSALEALEVSAPVTSTQSSFYASNSDFLIHQLSWLIHELLEKRNFAEQRYKSELAKASDAAKRAASRRPGYIISFFDLIRRRPPGARRKTEYRLSPRDYLNEISWGIDQLVRWRENPSTPFPIDLLVWIGECLGRFHEHTRSGRPTKSDLIRYNPRVIALLHQAEYENEQAEQRKEKKPPWSFHRVCREVFRMTRKYRDEFPGRAELKGGPRSNSIVKPITEALDDAGIVLPKDDTTLGLGSKKQ
jgi:hypothetical protein